MARTKRTKVVATPLPVVTKQGAQGDALFRRIDRLPDGVRKVAGENGAHIVAHSETGHHHTVSADGVVHYEGPNPLIGYLVLEQVQTAEVTHHRPWDTHLSFCLGGEGSVWEVRRQREGASEEVWSRVQD